ERKDFYYQIRNDYNHHLKNGSKKSSKIKKAAQIIFLNRTGYNGLFRVNSKGEYNVPAGRYKKPRILDENNLRRVSEALSIAEIEVADYRKIKSKTISKPAFFYFDPPYRPVSRTASFTSYNSHLFGEEEQHGLFEIYNELSQQNHKLMLSNSDPKNINDNDNFFDDLYHKYRINRVPAHRLVNSNSKKRGHVNEIIVTNY
ncbi:MAG: Dam family site-specific DNA-(adenine-N6)-methyltransferase, partial [Bacteroidales bacterium]|nr:Dam family site-specific DNA-(adenine-N6)-methyltransferase [Bacteroidales bacterium]